MNNQGRLGETYYRDSDYRNNWQNLPAGRPPRDEATMRSFFKAYYASISELDDRIGELFSKIHELKAIKPFTGRRVKSKATLKPSGAKAAKSVLI